MQQLIEPYNPGWKTEFENLKQVFTSVLKAFETSIQHVGSTSIPGMPAKPILDIDIIIQHKDIVPPITAQLESIGYFNKGEQGVAGRFAFRQTNAFVPFSTPSRKWQAHHLYVCLPDSIALQNHLVFRDALCNDSQLANRYAALKKSILETAAVSREEYTKRKTAFVLEVLSAAGMDADQLRQVRQANS